ncbi:RNA polymerase I-specific transcription-initiation factor-domain-containing protein [Paraphoma chrysanthemicola]|uniref:RNA polymerase I-specific transcription-initiation factor-domain-containing protein n=1 Tax=Paraphoma chrysanthemicola TaxID=798071 RepID=A0A8K0RAV5_9PLEO|nr:RNA polymerase I-specific transcription-initiation factor-domain-containing protein [Paraphoma chrysanthemicola]
MAERNLNHLNYGHAGEAAFNLDSQEWTFGRIFTTPNLTPIAVKEGTQTASTEVVPPSIQFPGSALSTRLTDANNNAKALLHQHPQLVPALDLLVEPSVTSAAILSTTSTYDPLVGNLFSTGSVTLEQAGRSGTWENPRRVAATVTGEAGNVLRLTMLYKQTLGWDVDKSVRIAGFTFKDADHGYWNEDAAPIQQVCFAESVDRSNFLAVRLPNRTVIFRPVHSQHSRLPGYSSHYELPASVLDAHPILILNLDQSGGAPHADVAFNPDFQFQFAVVDQNHMWSVWDIESNRKSDVYTITCLAQGPTVSQETEESTVEDGWGRIFWVGDVNTIMVCNRRHLNVFSLQAGSYETLPCAPIISPKSSDWILDAKRHPATRSQFLVLTSTFLFLVAVTTSADALDHSIQNAGTRIVTSWRHYRGAEDFTLSMSVQMLDETNLCLLLYSRLNNMVQMYTFVDNSFDDAPISSSSPTLIGSFLDGIGHVTSIAMDHLPFTGDTDSTALGVGRLYFMQGRQFYKLFTMQADLSVHEHIVYVPAVSKNGGNQQTGSVKDLGWSTIHRPKRYKNALEEEILDIEEFEALEGPISKLPFQAAAWRDIRDHGRNHSTLDLGVLYGAVSRRARSDDPKVDIPTLAGQLRERVLDSAGVEQLPLGTLMDFAGRQIDVSDIDEASTMLADLFTLENSLTRVRRIASIRLLQLGDDEADATLSRLYDDILHTWIASLPPDMPLRVRQRKERLARRIAAEVTLASVRILQQDVETDLSDTPRGPSQDGGISMPILSSQPLASSSPNTSHWPFSSPLPSVAASQSMHTLTSHPQSSQLSSQPHIDSLPSPKARPTPSDPIARLSKYLKFKDDAVASAPLPPTVNQLLSHWQPGEDPSKYDWEAIERADRAENMDVPSQQQQEKERRRKERREKKQKREDELARSQPSSQPFVFAKPVIPRSSPGPVLAGMNSSSQIPSQGYPQVPLPGTVLSSQGPFGAQSQVEPGKFGGRPDKKKKKKRVTGRQVGRGTARRGSFTSSSTFPMRNLTPQASSYTSYKLHLRPLLVNCTMSGFPSLQPAFTVRVDIDAPLPVGGQAGSQLVIVPMVSGTVKSEEGFEPKLDAELHGVGYDYIHNDASGNHMRLDVRSQVKNNDGTIFAMYYKGTVALTDSVKAVLGGSPDAKTTPYGDSFVTFTFETGSEKYKDLENGTYVAAGHFVTGEGKPGTVVEYKVSKVVQ